MCGTIFLPASRFCRGTSTGTCGRRSGCGWAEVERGGSGGSAPWIPCRGQGRRDLIETHGIVDRGWHAVLLPIGDLFDRTAQDLAGSRLRQPLHDDRLPERRDRADPLTPPGPELVADGAARPLPAPLPPHGPQRDPPLSPPGPAPAPHPRPA